METLSSILMAAAVIAVIILLLKIIAAPMKLAPNITADTAEMIMKITLDFISVAILSCLTKNIIHYKSRFVKLYRKKVFPITKKVTIA